MPGRRRGKLVEIEGVLVPRQTRPFEVAGKVFDELADEALRVNAKFLKLVTEEVARETTRIGSRYRIRGSKGNKVPLEAKSDVRAFRVNDGGLTVVGMVRGFPEGFWHIVENGSGRHLIRSRKARPGKARTTKGGKPRANALTRRQVERLFNTGGNLSELQPVAPASRAWAAQYAIHPGHDQIGTPWAESMKQAARIVETELTNQQTIALMRVWKGHR